MEINFIRNEEKAGSAPGLVRLPRVFIEQWFNELLKELKRSSQTKNKHLLKLKEISFVFLDEKSIKKINLEFRKVNKPTDVLSFSGDGVYMFGELLFCPKIIQKKALKENLPFRLYLVFLLTHGVLHLLGYEHEENEADEALMFEFQDKIFKKVAAKLAPSYKNDFHVSLSH